MKNYIVTVEIDDIITNRLVKAIVKGGCNKW